MSIEAFLVPEPPENRAPPGKKAGGSPGIKRFGSEVASRPAKARWTAALSTSRRVGLRHHPSKVIARACLKLPPRYRNEAVQGWFRFSLVALSVASLGHSHVRQDFSVCVPHLQRRADRVLDRAAGLDVLDDPPARSVTLVPRFRSS